MTYLSPEAIAKYRKTFYQREQTRHQANVERQQQTKQIVIQALNQVMQNYPMVKRVYLFGSMTRPENFRADSDIDLGVEDGTSVNMATCFNIWRDMERAVPGRAFDVRLLEKDDLFSVRVREKGDLIYERATTNA